MAKTGLILLTNMSLRVIHLAKTYQTKVREDISALSDVSVSFPEKGLVFLLGESGCGKSTFLSMLGGLLKPTSGEIFFKGISLSSMSREDLESYRFYDVGCVFQENTFVEAMNVADNIAIALPKGQENSELIQAALNNVNLPDYGSRRIDELSGGQKQRVAIARALVKNCSILLCDEPTASLDEMSAAKIFSLLKKLSEDRLVIMACHDRDAAYHYADRIIEIDHGQVLQDLVSQSAKGEIVYSGDRVFVPANHTMTNEDVDAFNKRLQEHSVTKVFAGPDARSFKQNENVDDQEPMKEERRAKTFSVFSIPKKLALSSMLKRKKQHILGAIMLGLTAGLLGTSAVILSYDGRENSIDVLNNATADYIALRKTSHLDGGLPLETYSPEIHDDDLIELSSFFDRECIGVKEADLSFAENIVKRNADDDGYTNRGISGFAEVKKNYFENNGFEIKSGSFPASDQEAIISTELADTFRRYGYHEYGQNSETYVLRPGFAYDEIIGKSIRLYNGSQKYTLTVSGVVKFTTDYSPYACLKKKDEKKPEDFFGKYEGVYNRCLKDDFAWNIYVKDIRKIGEDHYDKALMTIPETRKEIARIYDVCHGGKSSLSSDYAMTNAHLETAEYIAMNLPIFFRIFLIAAGIFGIISTLLIWHLSSTTISIDKKQTGLFLAMGATKKNVAALYLLQSVIFSAASSLLGLALLIAMPATINFLFATELLYMTSLVCVNVWHVSIIVCAPQLLSALIMLFNLLPVLAKEPIALLKRE